MEEAAGERSNLAGVQHILLVLSGKGGVGKSTISTQLALALRHSGKKINSGKIIECHGLGGTSYCNCQNQNQASYCSSLHALHRLQDCQCGEEDECKDMGLPKGSLGTFGGGVLIDCNDLIFGIGFQAKVLRNGFVVGILDVDLCGPSIPRMFRVQDSDVHQCNSGWVPVFVGQDKNISLMSIAFLLEKPDDAVVWRGPKKNALIKQFVADVAWGDLDFLVVDTPPGTSDEHISTVEALRPYKPLGAILVTTPQAVSVGDVRRELTFCKKAGLKVLGIVENMSGFVCPHCSECTNIFSKGGGEELAKHTGVPFLGCVPLDPQLSQSLEEGKDFIQEFPKSAAFPALAHIAQQVLDGTWQQTS